MSIEKTKYTTLNDFRPNEVNLSSDHHSHQQQHNHHHHLISSATSNTTNLELYTNAYNNDSTDLMVALMNNQMNDTTSSIIVPADETAISPVTSVTPLTNSSQHLYNNASNQQQQSPNQHDHQQQQQQQQQNNSGFLLTLGTTPRFTQIISQSVASSIMNPNQPSHINLGQNGFNNTGSHTYLRIIEQPVNRIRYRYKSEKGSHGGLTGENSTQTKKTFPTVRLENYRGSRQLLIKASLYTNEENPRPHIHKLMGKYCNEDGVCIVPLSDNNTASFQNLGILFVSKKEVPEIIYRQKLEEQRIIRAFNDSGLSEEEKKKLREEAERDAKRINLNNVRICFQAFDCNSDVHYPICDPIFSRSIANQKSPDSGELKIVRMDKVSGFCTGNEEVFLLCEKVNKKDIKIRFFETDEDGNVCWEAYGNFTEADVHHQVAIVFRTPAYRDLNIEQSVQVYLQLFRQKDKEYSEPRPFTYKPKQFDIDNMERKKKKLAHYNPNYGGGNLTSNAGSHFGHLNAGSSANTTSSTSRCYTSSSDMGNTSLSNFTDNSANTGRGNNRKVISVSNPARNSEARKVKRITSVRPLSATASSLPVAMDVEDKLDHSSEINLVERNLRTLRNVVISGDIRHLFHSWRQLIEVPDENGDTLLHLSLIHQAHHEELIEFLFEISKELINERNLNSETILHLSVILNKTRLARKLISLGANPNLTDRNGNTALHIAAKNGYTKMVEVLLSFFNYVEQNERNIIDPNLLNYDGLTALHLSVLNGHEEIAKQLISCSLTDINIRESKAGRSLLHLAIDYCPSLVKFIVEKKSIDINQRDYSGNTALHIASARQLDNVIDILVKFGAEQLNSDESEFEEDDDERDESEGEYYIDDSCDIESEDDRSDQRVEIDFTCDDDDDDEFDAKVNVNDVISERKHDSEIKQHENQSEIDFKFDQNSIAMKLQSSASASTSRVSSASRSMTSKSASASLSLSEEFENTSKHKQINNDALLEEDITELRFDSGYGGSHKKINILDDDTIDKLGSILDNSKQWQTLACCLGMDVDDEIMSSEKPTRIVLEKYEKQYNGNLSGLERAVTIANLENVKQILKESAFGFEDSY